MGQTTAILTTTYGLNFDISIGWCFLAIGALVITNLVAGFVYPENRRLLEQEVFLLLLFDLLQLGFLLYLTGGLNNPFALMMIAPVTVSAMTMQPQPTLILGGLAIILVTLLSYFHVPLQDANGFVFRMPPLFVLGFWAAMMIGIVFLAIYARRVTAETYAMSQALLATQMALSREQKLTDLGGVVAAAAHEMGTPLATIKLVSSELVEELEDPTLRADAELIREQADRCRDILRSMGRTGKDDLHLRTAPLSAVVEEAAEPHMARGKEVHFSYVVSPGGARKMPNIQRRPEVIHGLRNLIQNAVDFARCSVWIDTKWSDDHVSIRIIDDGNGYPTDLLGRIGDPFIRRRAREAKSSERPEYEGMGLGLFIAKTLLERSGAETIFANGSIDSETPGSGHDRSGAIAEVVWPSAAIVIDVTPGTQALGENRPIPI
ncbi:sensor histidine kinase RegB [Litoreibacter roseus]|uniref:histidine kinase n=2 Tax=Litoreibacter roseus TaxID=2601869 RepID=A0A6N6JFN7_9RHOB|nr:sensor histidine kinase RegB [Litoreibacter roseus]